MGSEDNLLQKSWRAYLKKKKKNNFKGLPSPREWEFLTQVWGLLNMLPVVVLTYPELRGSHVLILLPYFVDDKSEALRG